MKATDIIIQAIVTEKANKLSEKGTYVFYVNRKAGKIEVKKAIKELYGHDAKDVKMLVTSKKMKLVRRKSIAKRPEMKKAFVSIKGGKKLDLTKPEKEAKKAKAEKETKE